MDDPGPMMLVLQIILLFVLILVNAFFAMSEIAIISLNDAKIEKMAQEGNKKAKKVLKLTSNSSNFLSTIQIGVTLAGFLTSASASQTFADRLTNAVAPAMPMIPAGVIRTVSVILITLIISYFSLVLGELAPKRIAMQKPEKISFMAVGFLVFFAKATKPLVKLLSFSTNVIVRLFGFDPNADEEMVTEEEIRMLVDVGGEKGVIENVQKEMINNIFEFDNIDVGDIMTHRTDISAVEVNEPVADVIKIAIEDGYSRIPVYTEDLDDIIGIAYIKDLLKFIGSDLPKNKSLRDFIRKPFYVPETKKCGDLFREMTESHIQMAVVVDEYGGTAGIVTLEDLIESIVGNIQDEYDNEDEEISQINENTFTIDGTTDLDEVAEITGRDYPEGDYDTLGGFIISLLGFLPQDGELNAVTYEDVTFTVLNVEERRIGKVRVEIVPALAQPAEEDTGTKKTTKKDRRAKKEKKRLGDTGDSVS